MDHYVHLIMLLSFKYSLGRKKLKVGEEMEFEHVESQNEPKRAREWWARNNMDEGRAPGLTVK